VISATKCPNALEENHDMEIEKIEQEKKIKTERKYKCL
jgi:hypothetical protein